MIEYQVGAAEPLFYGSIPFTSPFPSSALPYTRIHLQPSGHSVHMNVERSNHVTAFTKRQDPRVFRHVLDGHRYPTK
jgi:hypothetical protein